MELVSGFLLWLLADVLGIKAIRKESNVVRKVLMTIAFLVVGFVGVVLFFLIFGQPK